MRKKKLSPLLRKILNLDTSTPKKSRFQQRLEEMQLKHGEEPTGEPTEPKVSLHDKKNPIPWISSLDELPPYYMSIDIYSGEVLEDWARVSHGGEVDGKDDFYVNNRDSKVIDNITHWRKRPDVNYESYEPMTTHDVPLLSTNDVKDIVASLNKLITNLNPNPYLVYYNSAMEGCIDVIESALKEKTKSALLRGNTSIRPPGI